MASAVSASVTRSSRMLPHPPEELTHGRLQRLGEGVGKVVYASEHWVVKRERSPGEVVALKILPPGDATSADFVARKLTMIGREHGIPVPGTEGFLLDEVGWEDHDVLEAEHAAFAASCLDGAPVVVDAAAGRRALAAALAVTEGIERSKQQAMRSGLVKSQV